MPDSKITALTSISTSTDPANDPLVIVDVSDTSMAATGTTKKVTLNQLLGASGTATLASATITGDLTVDTSTLKVDSANNRVGIGTASPAVTLDISDPSAVIRATSSTGTNTSFAAFANTGGAVRVGAENSAGGGLFTGSSAYSAVFGTTGAYSAHIGTNSSVRYSIASDGVATWSNVGGVAGTAMTLNSTGLGVGRTPGARLDTQGTTSDSSAYAFFARNSVGNAMVYIRNDGRCVFGTGASDNIFFEPSGNVGIGVTSARSKADVYGTLTVGSNTAPNCDFKRDVAISGADSGIGSLNYGARYDATNYGVGALITGQSAGAWTSTSTPGYISLRTTPASATAPVETVRLKSTGQVRFVPLASDPSGAEAGDVYYNSTSNKLKCYNGTTWNDLF